MRFAMKARERYELRIADRVEKLSSEPGSLKKVANTLGFLGKLWLGRRHYGLSRDFIKTVSVHQ